jgi:dTDP-4-dehydrorhamnose reductase
VSDGPILLIGANGQVGRELFPLLNKLGTVITMPRSELDLGNAASIRGAIRELKPRWIVNAAAYTAVDMAESDAAAAFAINGVALGVIGEEALRVGAPVIHFSTDYVFAGDGDRPWSEDDPTHPLSVYGSSKLAGEKALANSGATHLIFRTSWVYGTQGQNFLLTILALARERDELRIVNDQHGSPTWSRTLAQLVTHVIGLGEETARKRGLQPAEAVAPIAGVYHACSKEFTTWFGFASEFLRMAQAANPQQHFATLIPVPSSAYPTAAKRPENSRLNCEKLARDLGFTLPLWQDSTSEVMVELLAQHSA